MNKGLFKTALLLLMMAASVTSVFGQDMKPRIMVLPADQWCTKNGFVTTCEYVAPDLKPVQEKSSDYIKAWENNETMRAMIAGMENFFQKENFDIVSFEQALNAVKTSHSIESGSYKDQLLKKMFFTDIILEIDFAEKKTGPKTQIEFNLQALDAYSEQVISRKSGAFITSPATIADEFQKAVMGFKDSLLSDLMNHYNTLFSNGRQIVVDIRCSDKCPFNLEDTYGDSKLSELIEDWMSKNTVNGRFSTDYVSKNQMTFSQVSIPLVEGKTQGNTSLFRQDLKRFITKTTGQAFKLREQNIGLRQVIFFLDTKPQ